MRFDNEISNNMNDYLGNTIYNIQTTSGISIWNYHWSEGLVPCSRDMGNLQIRFSLGWLCALQQWAIQVVKIYENHDADGTALMLQEKKGYYSFVKLCPVQCCTYWCLYFIAILLELTSKQTFSAHVQFWLLSILNAMAV